jgi:hypothetical protein
MCYPAFLSLAGFNCGKLQRCTCKFRVFMKQVNIRQCMEIHAAWDMKRNPVLKGYIGYTPLHISLEVH